MHFFLSFFLLQELEPEEVGEQNLCDTKYVSELCFLLVLGPRDFVHFSS